LAARLLRVGALAFGSLGGGLAELYVIPRERSDRRIYRAFRVAGPKHVRV